jgi:predicted nucleotidyltransferase
MSHDAHTPHTADTILRLLNERAVEMRERFGVVRIGLFGSWVRNEAKPDSDVDILVSLSRPTFDAYMDLKLYLEDLLGRCVDVVMVTALRPRLREHVLREVRYAA